ncbi:MAG: AI-2E family transporter [Thermomicrobiales bacterium]
MVNGYVVGQTIVSSCFGVFTFVVLTVVGTPEALLLAVLAAMLDAIPMVGATLATIPAVLMSLTVSVPAALVVLGLFVIYQQVENNFIAPRAFRNTLKISSLAVLLAVSFGSALFGVLGAMCVAGRGGDSCSGAWIARRRADAATGKRLAVLAVGAAALAIP